MQTVLIGNSPSSGSTFLADLLDSSDVSVCGEEIGVFSNPYVYRLDSFKKSPKKHALFFNLYFDHTMWNADNFHYYGMRDIDMLDLIKSSNDFLEFANQFSKRTLALRGKNDAGVLFEKTPENTNCIGEFLAASPESKFIFLVRNPLFVYNSLRNRGFSDFVSLCTWFFEAAKFYPYRNHERVQLLRYEDLVSKPFEIASNLINRYSGQDTTADGVKKGYENNSYRKYFSIKMDTWSQKGFGLPKNVNDRGRLSEDVLSGFMKYSQFSINQNYANRLKMQAMSFTELIECMGYADEINSILQEVPREDKAKAGIGLGDKKRLFNNWKVNYLMKEVSLSDLQILMQPVNIR